MKTSIIWRGQRTHARVWLLRRPQGFTVGEERQRKRQSSEKKGIKTNDVTFHFSKMADKIMQERERIINTFSNVPPQPFYVGDIVVNKPSEREIYLKQIEPLEWTPCLLGYNSVDEYIFRKQHEEANNLDDIRMGENFWFSPRRPGFDFRCGYQMLLVVELSIRIEGVSGFIEVHKQPFRWCHYYNYYYCYLFLS